MHHTIPIIQYPFNYFLLINSGAVFAGVMPKIIRILEMLEAFVRIRDEKTTEITNMGSIMDDLQHQSLKKDEKQEEVLTVLLSINTVDSGFSELPDLVVIKVSKIHGYNNLKNRYFVELKNAIMTSQNT